MHTMEEMINRPWGYFQILKDEPEYKIKKIAVKPNGCLSLQRHQRRSEHWFTLDGTGVATVGDKIFPLQKGATADIPEGTVHRLENTGNIDLIIIEIQTGTYFGEDDIERLEDRYGRI